MIDENGNYYEYENGVKVTYTNSSTNILHLNDEYDNGYDAKMKTPASGADGSLDYFTSSSPDWSTHSHGNINSSGSTIEYHDEDNRAWQERNHLMELLSDLTLDELQIIEKCHNKDLKALTEEILINRENTEVNYQKVLKLI